MLLQSLSMMSLTTLNLSLFPADPRHPIRELETTKLHPSLYLKPALPKRPTGPLPPKPAIAAKPLLPSPAASTGEGEWHFSAPSSNTSAEKVQLRLHAHVGNLGETTEQVICHSVADSNDCYQETNLIVRNLMFLRFQSPFLKTSSFFSHNCLLYCEPGFLNSSVGGKKHPSQFSPNSREDTPQPHWSISLMP